MAISTKQTVNLVFERLSALPRLRSPAPLGKRVLAYLHSGEAHRAGLSKLLQASGLLCLAVGGIVWLIVWPLVYEEFERWGLVQAFVAQMIWLVTLLLIAKITLLRAGHLRALPPDDFVSLRAAGLLCRCFAEVMLVLVVGAALATLMHPINPFFLAVVSDGSTAAGGSGGAQSFVGLLSGAWILLWLAVAVPLFILFYGLATAIEVYLAIEFNTRSGRVGKQLGA